MWIRDYHVDALRLDAVHAIYTCGDASARGARAEVRALPRTRREVAVIAESDLNDPRLLRASEVSGYGLTRSGATDFHTPLQCLLTMNGTVTYADFGSLSDLASAFERVFVYGRSLLAVSRPRHGRPATGLDGRSLRVFCRTTIRSAIAQAVSASGIWSARGESRWVRPSSWRRRSCRCSSRRRVGGLGLRSK